MQARSADRAADEKGALKIIATFLNVLLAQFRLGKGWAPALRAHPIY
jgi:hypothetical protein